MQIVLAQLAQKLGVLLKQHGWYLATAESCTGGCVAQVVTNVAGSSQWFDCGFVTYSNESKQSLLGVTNHTLKEYGAVSSQAASGMAQGAIMRSSAHISVGITGIAGPDGGTTDKPVGTVWISWAIRHQPIKTLKFQFVGSRQEVRDQAVKAALEGLIELIIENN
jgi:nicotinamide-nucleotide amidase